MKNDLASIRFMAMNILSGREHSRFELRNKLYRKLSRKLQRNKSPRSLDESESESESDGGELETLIDIVLEQLLEDKLLDDRRFTETFVRSRMMRGSGPVKIHHELMARGVSSEIIDDYLDDSYEFWQETIEAVRSKRFGRQYPENYKEQTKQSRFLYQRGFGAELIRRLFNDYN